MATAASSYYSEVDDDRPLAQNAQVGRSGSHAADKSAGLLSPSRSGFQSGGSSVDFEPSNETEEHRVRKGLMPTSEGAPQLHPVKNSSHIPDGEAHSGLVGTDGRPLSHEQQHNQRDLNDTRDQHQHQSSGGLLGGDGQQQGEQYTARDEGLEPYSAPPPAHQQGDNNTSSGYLPDKKIGPAGGATTQQPGHNDNSNTGLTSAHDNNNYNNNDNNNNNYSADPSNNNRRSILADPSHPDNILVEELERRAQKSGTHAVGFGTHGDEEPPSAQEQGYDPNPAHILGNSSSNDNTHHAGGLAAGGLGAAGLGAAGYSRNTGNTVDNEGDHTDTEAPDMQPSQSYIQRQSVYSQPPSTRAGDNNTPLEQQKTGQSYGNQEAPFSSRDYGQNSSGRLVPAGGGVIRPVAGVLPEDAEGGALARNYEPSHYTQAGMAGVGAGSAAALGAGALGTRSSGASAVGTGAVDPREYAQQAQQQPYDNQQQMYNNQQQPYDNQQQSYDNQQQPYDNQQQPYDNQQQQQYAQPQAQQMEAYPSQQTQRTQQTAHTFGTTPAHHSLNQEQQPTRELQNDQHPSHHQQYDQPAMQQGDNVAPQQQHQQQSGKMFIPAPMPIFQNQPQQDSRLQEELPGQQQSQLIQQPQHQQPFQSQQLQDQPFQQQPGPQDQQMNGINTAVPVKPSFGTAPQSTRNSVYPGSQTGTSAPAPIAGGGLAAAIATSGHEPTKDDKKSLKKEIKSERKFEKSLKQEAKKEAEEIEIAMKMAKLSLKKADKSGRYEANFRSSYEKAIKKEVAAKQRLLRVTNEYNKVAADLEKATKEMEIRRNAHIADVQTRDADSNKVDELRRIKGQHDMEREARHGSSLTKQNQAKRALSMSSKRKSSLF